MTADEKERIISNDYADLLIAYGGNLSLLQGFDNATIQIINYLHAVVHLPVAQITQETILGLGYASLPSVFGLISEASLEASGVTRLRNIPNFNLRGQGILLGIIDSGIDYTNPVFKNADNTTRILSIWDQTIQSDNVPAIANYGTEYTREQINEALQSETPLDIVPSTDEVGHGTMLAGIAGGSAVPESNFTGVAPEVDFVVVKLKPAKQNIKKFFLIPEDAICYQENDIIFGLEYLVNVALSLNRPIAICIALGTSQGAHDGRGTLSSYLSLIAEYVGFAVVVAAGNEGSARRHYFGTVDHVLGYDMVELNVGENEPGFSMELWGRTPFLFTVDIQSPSGEYIPRIVPRLDEHRQITFIFEPTIINIDYQMVESQSGDQLILMRFQNPAPGIWRFRVYGSRMFDETFHIWLPMTGFISDDTYFIRSDPYTTILSLGNAPVPLTVTAYDTVDDSLYVNASRGYSRIGDIKPELAAPGVSILAPNLEHGFNEVTGTSASAAHTTGVAAMFLEWAIVRGNQQAVNTQQMKVFMIRGAKRNLEIEYPNRDWGYGILDIYNVFDALRRGV
ncbi:S8 family peptidase [Lachnospiraceae bacterium MD1]|jgi:subtilisin family serine protease|uniref:S8 family peptidase n=1 Tax=Variimorphobacter saccharofermentans TaxID=2755051 RepID=A0A839JWM6_9FIRM|nr:S8 family peptidase [Variimorphobacter saccharofermentans]MBB2181648.1 S8 family peptidase [Variimorphobacter saccharofermentans]